MSDLDRKRLKVLKCFAQAWNDHDLEALMLHMAEDCIFRGAAGSLIVGSEFVGRQAVAAGYLKIFEAFPDAAWNEDSHFVAGDRGVSEWHFTGTGTDGVAVEMMGCDLFEFEGDKLRVKDSYRKHRT